MKLIMKFSILMVVMASSLTGETITPAWLEQNAPDSIQARREQWYQLKVPVVPISHLDKKKKIECGFAQPYILLWWMKLISGTPADFDRNKTIFFDKVNMRSYMQAVLKTRVMIFPQGPFDSESQKQALKAEKKKERTGKRELSVLPLPDDPFAVLPLNAANVDAVLKSCGNCLPAESMSFADNIVNIAFYNKQIYLHHGAGPTRSSEQKLLEKAMLLYLKTYEPTEKGNQERFADESVLLRSAHDLSHLLSVLKKFRNATDMVCGVQLSLSKGHQHEIAIVVQKVGGVVNYYVADPDAEKFRFTSEVMKVKKGVPHRDYIKITHRPSAFGHYRAAFKLIKWLFEGPAEELRNASVRAAFLGAMQQHGKLAKKKRLDTVRQLKTEPLPDLQSLLRKEIESLGLQDVPLYLSVYRPIVYDEVTQKKFEQELTGKKKKKRRIVRAKPH